MKSVVEHTDEPYPHIHFYVVPKKGEKFDSIHEGYAAMNAVPKESPRIDRKTAFGVAMTAWQDEVYLAFGLKYGLARTAPGGSDLPGRSGKSSSRKPIGCLKSSR